MNSAGKDISIDELAQTIKKIVGFNGAIAYETDKPDGTPKKLLDVTRMTQLGWQADIDLHQGIAETYAWYLNQ